MPKPHVARTPQALAALTSPLRLEIVDWFQAEKQLSIREVAERLGRKPSSVTYHVRCLEEVGVLVEVDRRPSGRRHEAVYALAAPDVQIGDASGESDAERARLDEHRIRTLRTLLRQAEREYAQATRARGDRPVPRDTLFATRQRARLTVAERREVARHLRAIQTLFQGARSRRRGTACSFSAVLAPLVQDVRE